MTTVIITGYIRKRLTLFPADIYLDLPAEQDLVRILLDNDFLTRDPANSDRYFLSGTYRLLIDHTEVDLPPSENILVWFESFDEPRIQVGADSQYIETVKIPGSETVIGNLDVAYSLIGDLHDDLEAI